MRYFDDDKFLAKYVGNLNSKGVFKLNLSDKNIKTCRNDTFGILTLNNGTKYYIKTVSDKIIADSEIMCSYIFEKAKIPVVHYYPVEINSKLGVISKDATTIAKDVKNAKTLNPNIKENDNCKGVYSLIELTEFDKPKDILSKKAINNTIKTAYFDIAHKNYDRHGQNFYYFRNIGDKKYKDIVLIDNGYSGYVCLGMSLEAFNKFYITMSGGVEYDKILLENILKKPDWNGFVTPKNMLEELSRINVREIAKQIKAETGYKIDKKYLDFLDESYYNMCETIDKNAII